MKIIVTTRNKKVVDYPNLRTLTYPHEPRRLKDNESWELFRKLALFHWEEETSNSMDIAKLEALGKEMLRKCKGLPLAVIALAGILSDKETLEEWEKINKAVSSRIMKDGKGTHLYGPVNQMLALSFSDLPLELKPCFLYLARYPEDRKIHVGRMIRMWIAEGFFTTAKLHQGETAEDVARRYLDELVQRCMVQVESRGYEGKAKVIQMHDIVRDLCITKAKEEDFLESFSYESQNLDAIATKSGRVAILSSLEDDISFPIKSQKLRSLEFTVEGSFEANEKILSFQVINERYKLLRVLLLKNIRTPHDELPAEIGSLIHLRYLGLFDANIRRLPSSIGNLRNLLTLECRSSYSSFRIPNVFWKIESLRYLCFHGYIDFNGEGLKFHTLKYLQALKGVSGGSWMLKELPRLSPTVQKLDIGRITSQAEVEAALQCPSIREDSLRSLTLRWTNVKQGVVVKLENILKPIIHSQHLRKLVLWGRIGSDGLSNTQFPRSIKKLVLSESELEAEATLGGLGKLPQLTILKLWEAYMGTMWSCTAGDFPQLKKLVLDRLENLEEWSIELGAMPQLKNLKISSCWKLRRIPEGLEFITTLQALSVDDMPEEFEKRMKGGGEDAHIIQHVPLVQIY